MATASALVPSLLGSIGVRLAAVILFILASLAFYFVDRLPAARPVDGREFRVDHTDALVFYGLGKGPLLSFDGALGEGLDLRADVARLSSDTLAALRDGGFALPAAKGSALAWLGKVDPQGRITLKIENLRPEPDPGAGVAIAQTGTLVAPQLRITALDTALAVSAQPVFGDSDSTSPLLMKVDGREVPQPLASLAPLNFELPPGESLLLTFANAAAAGKASFMLGQPDGSGELASHLPVERFEAGPRTPPGSEAPLAELDRGVCGARAGKMLLHRLRPLPETCGRDGALAIESLAVSGGELEVAVSGSGFETENGRTLAAGLATTVANNKLLAALLGIILAAFAGWVWRTVTHGSKS